MGLDQRRASRISCELPIRIYGRMDDVLGEVKDMSRTGVRLQVSLPARVDDIQKVARAVEQYLGVLIKVDLNQAAPVRKQLRIVRLGHESLEDGKVELGCEFDWPLTDEEVWRIGLHVPPMRSSMMPATSTQRMQRRYSAYLIASEGWRTPVMSGTTPGLDKNAVLFQADRTPRFRPASDDVTTVAMELARSYGPEPLVEIVDGHRQVWKGPTRIRRVQSNTSSSSLMRVWAEPTEV